MTFNQYEIVIVNLDPTIGSEIRKKRPCIIISPNEMNKHLQTIIIVPVTSQSRTYPTRVSIRMEDSANWAVVDQIRTIDKIRITKTIGKLSIDEITSIKQVIKETFVD